MDVGATIRMVRERRKLSISELAGLSGVDPSYIWNIENGKRTPSLKRLLKITEALGVPIHIMMLLSYDREGEARGLTLKQARQMGRRLLKAALALPWEAEGNGQKQRKRS